MEEEKKVVEDHKKSKLPIILLVLVLLIGVGCGGYFLGKKINDKPKNEPKTEEKKDSKVAYGSDKNTSGLEIVDTKTKNIKLNDIEYEVKIEILLAEDGIRNYQNVYFNGYKIIDNMEVFYEPHGEIEEEKELYEKSNKTNIETELSNIKTIKDSKTDDEYLIFDDYREYYYKPFFQYIVNPKGEIIAKLCKMQPGIYDILEKDGKEIYFQSLTKINSDYILFLPLQNIIKIPFYGYDFEKNMNFELEENKLVIENGKAIVTKSTIYKSSDGYKLSGAGQILEFTKDEIEKYNIIEPAK